MSQEQYDLGMGDEEYELYLEQMENERELMDR